LNSLETNSLKKIRALLFGSRYQILFIGLFTILAFSVIMQTALSTYHYQEKMYAIAEDRAIVLVNSLAKRFSDAIYFNDIEQIRKELELIGLEQQVKRIAVFANDGYFLIDSVQEKVPAGSIETEILDQLKLSTAPSIRRGTRQIEAVTAIKADWEIIGGLYLNIDLTEVYEHAQQDLKNQILQTCLILLLAILLSATLNRMLRTSRSLQASQSMFRELINQSPVSTSIFHPDGSLFYINPAQMDMRGIQERDLSTFIRTYNIFEDDQLQSVDIMPLIKRGFTTEVTHIVAFEYRPHSPRANDRTELNEIWVEAVIFPMRNSSGDIDEVVVIFEDVSIEETARRERARLHDQILQSQKYEGLGVLAGGIAHDFNNLMTPILGNADLLGQKIPPGSTDHAHVEAILSASIRASDLCKQMLEYAGSGEYSPEAVDLTDEVEAMSHLLEISTPKSAELVKKLNYQLPVVMVDRIQIRDVILNLLINAAEALEGKAGRITLETGMVELTESGDEHLTIIQKIPSGHYVYLELTDTGSGFDEQTRQKIFDPFYTTKFQGRGLGLSSVLGVLSSHGGGISVISTPGSGSIFRAYFPVIEK
jgi:PAS domain S-box-containing protein